MLQALKMHSKVWICTPRVVVAMTMAGVIETVSAASPLEEGAQAYDREDYTQAIRILSPLAQSGDRDAQDLLGASYEEGQGDFVTAALWYQKAAAQAQSDALTRLGELYEDGDGVPQDTQKALDCFEQAASLGDEDAETDLGEIYTNVIGDNGEAAKHFSHAAEEGDAQAQYRLGLLLLGEEGVTRDVSRAWMYLSLAADAVDDAAESRDVLELEMSPQDLNHARGLLKDWLATHHPATGISKAH